MYNLFDVTEEYAKHPQLKREEVQKFLQWIESQPHLPHKGAISEQEAMLFLTACDHSMEYAKEVLDNYLTCRTHFEDMFGELDVASAEWQRDTKAVAGFGLKERSPDGNLVILGKIVDLDASHFCFSGVMKLYCLGSEFILQETGVVPGIRFVIDFTGFSLGHLTRIGLLQLKRFLYYLQEAAPARLNGLHFINVGAVVDKLMGLMMPFMKKELLERFHVHRDMESFYQFVPQRLMPRDMGGEQASVAESYEQLQQKLHESRSEILLRCRTHRINEKLRPAKSKPSSELFGMQGNFKKLDID